MLKGVNYLVVVLFVGIFMCGFISAWADNGSAVQNVDGCGEMNVTGGVYTLTGNLTDNSTANCLTIRANDIRINGNEFTVNGNVNANNLSVGEFGEVYAAYNNLTLNNMDVWGDVYANGGSDLAGGNGGSISLFNSTAINIYSNGGLGALAFAGNGGSISLFNSTAISIYSNGGESDSGTTGNGGAISVFNSVLVYPFTVSVAKGILTGSGTDGGVAGSLNMTNVLINNSNASILFSFVNVTSISSDLTISRNNVSINSSANSLYSNLSATITLRDTNVTFAPKIYKDNSVCPSNICSNLTSTGDSHTFQVSG